MAHVLLTAALFGAYLLLLWFVVKNAQREQGRTTLLEQGRTTPLGAISLLPQKGLCPSRYHLDPDPASVPDRPSPKPHR
jgi:hypothetical protein